MEELFAKWIREAILEQEKAVKHQNVYKLAQMETLIRELKRLRDRLTISMT